MKNGINIWSGTKGLGGALTNPNCLAKRKGSIVQDYPVAFQGRNFSDAEEAYQTIKNEKWPLTWEERVKLLTEVMTAKLEQHPRLVKAISDAGGLEWLNKCWHKTWAKSPEMQRWEGKGKESPTISCLIAAYQAVGGT